MLSLELACAVQGLKSGLAPRFYFKIEHTHSRADAKEMLVNQAWQSMSENSDIDFEKIPIEMGLRKTKVPMAIKIGDKQAPNSACVSDV